MKKFKAPNGEIIEVQDIQASAFERAGFVPVKEKPAKDDKDNK